MNSNADKKNLLYYYLKYHPLRVNSFSLFLQLMLPTYQLLFFDKDSYIFQIKQLLDPLISKLAGRIVHREVNAISGWKTDAQCSTKTFNLITKLRSESSTVKNPNLALVRQTLDCFAAFAIEVYLLFNKGRINFMLAPICLIDLYPTEPWVWHVSFIPSHN